MCMPVIVIIGYVIHLHDQVTGDLPPPGISDKAMYLTLSHDNFQVVLSCVA